MEYKVIRKIIVSLILVMLVSILQLSIVNAAVDQTGLLDGKTIKTGSRIDNILGSTTLMTDNNISTSYTLVNERSDSSVSDSLIYTFNSPITINAYKLNILNYNNGPIYIQFFNSSGTIIGNFSSQIKGDDNKYAFSQSFSNVKSVLVFQKSSISYKIAEFNLYNITPDTPLNPNATAGDSQVTLTWDQVANADSYIVKYGTESGKYTETVTATKDQYGNFVIPGLTNGTTYYFVVSATVNGVGSGYSTEVYATPVTTQKPLLDVIVDKDNVAVGENFVANISLKNVNNIYAEDFTIQYDTNLFEFIGFDEITGYKVYNTPADDNGKIRFIVSSQGKNYGISQDTTFLKLKFKAKAAGTGNVDAQKCRIADTKNEWDLGVESCGIDTITVGDPLILDVNKSGEYSLVDLAIDGYYFGDAAADTDTVNHIADQVVDGYVNDTDLLYIVNQMLNNPNYPPNL